VTRQVPARLPTVSRMRLSRVQRSRHVRWTVVASLTLVWFGLMLGFADYLTGSQATSRHAVTARLQARVSAEADFASLYMRDISNRERAQTAIWLRGLTPSHHSMVMATGALGAARNFSPFSPIPTPMTPPSSPNACAARSRT